MKLLPIVLLVLCLGTFIMSLLLKKNNETPDKGKSWIEQGKREGRNPELFRKRMKDKRNL